VIIIAATSMPTSGSSSSTVTVVISTLALAISIGGFTLSLLTFRWNRHEKAREAVTNITRAMCKTLYHLSRCKEARRRRDLLVFHHSPIAVNSDAAHHAESLLSDYTTNLGKAAESHGILEAELAAQRHRFDLTLLKLISELQIVLSRIGDAVNRGDHNAYDVLHIRFGKLIKYLSDATKHLSLSSDALEEIKEKPAIAGGDDWISETEMRTVSELVHKRATNQANNTFLVFGPQIILNDSSLLKSPGLAEKLRNHPFAVSFQDGTTVKLTFAQFVFFVYEIIFLAQQIEEVASKLNKADFKEPTKVEVKTSVKTEELMSDAVLQVLMTKVEFSPIPAERAANNPAGTEQSTPVL
jgi:hypothetical protein